MSKLIVFNSVSIDGFFTDEHGDLSWAHNPRADQEWDNFVAGNAGGDGTLVFGRKTYELMASYWPTPLAAQNDPAVAEGMNRLRKVVFSRTMKTATWGNTRLVKDGLVPEIMKMKAENGPDMVILGSGSLVAQLTRERLIDEYQIVTIPVILGGGRTLFEGIGGKLLLKRVSTHAFDNGNVFSSYTAS